VVVAIAAPDGHKRELELTRDLSRRADQKWVAGEYPRPRVVFRWEDEDERIAYLALNNFGNPRTLEDFNAIWPELKKASGLIIDIRKNGGGSSDVFVPILQHFAGSPYEEPLIEARVNNSARRAWAFQGWSDYAAYGTTGIMVRETPKWTTHERWNGEPLVVPTAILAGPNTASAAESFMMFARSLPQVFFVGEQRFGSSGQPLVFEVPGGVGVMICAVRELWPDGTRFVGIGITPDFPASPRVSDFRVNRDQALERALEEIRKLACVVTPRG